MTDRIRATFMTNKDTWEHAHALLKEKGFPQGTLALYLTQCVENLTLQLEHTDGKALRIMLDK